MTKLEYKLEIEGRIEVKTGLHIGGSDIDLEIGGKDNQVAKYGSDGRPYIPGTSLSGKLRDLIARSKGYKYLDYNSAKQNDDIETKSWDQEYLALLFAGQPFNANFKKEIKKKKTFWSNKSNNNKNGEALCINTRLLVRDDFELDPDKLLEKVLEDKSENTINRNTGIANPRHVERVSRGTEFKLKMILDVYEHDEVDKLLETLNLGINLLNYDYLGGMGSRGSGEVRITIDNIIKLVFSGGKINRTNFTEYTFSIE